MARLLEPARLGTLEVRNRVVMAPMCMYSCASRDGVVGDFHVVHYGARSYGGVGLVICEATAVAPEGRITVDDAGLWNDAQVPAYARVADTIRAGGARAAVQLGHAGRKAKSTPEPLGPSPIAFNDAYPVPVELTPKELDRVAADFGSAARRAVEAGFEAVEVHAAHGYLLSSFLSPLSNHRHDAYGKDRTLFLEQVLSSVRTSLPSGMTLLLRVSAADWADGGNTPETVAEMLSNGILDRYGVSVIDVSSGGVVDSVPNAFPGFQLEAAQTISESLDVRVIAGGLIDSPDLAESAVQEGRADFIFLGRALLRDPHWVLRAAHHLHHPLTWPRQYERGGF